MKKIFLAALTLLCTLSVSAQCSLRMGKDRPMRKLQMA